MSEQKRKKNCLNCMHGQFESDGDYGGIQYFVCYKREDDGINNLDKNLCKESYRNKSKTCCELSTLPVIAECTVCGCDDVCWPDDVDTHVCFPCYCENAEKGESCEN